MLMLMRSLYLQILLTHVYNDNTLDLLHLSGDIINHPCSFVQYEIKSSGATPFLGPILMRFEWLEPPQVFLHASQFAFKSVEN